MLLSCFQDYSILCLVLGVFSVITFLGTLIFIPFLITRLPSDYFQPKRRRSYFKSQSISKIGLLILIVKNVLGVFFVLMGLIMLILPGQGILTILVGLMLLNFPGKYYLERRLVEQSKVLSMINWIRLKAGQERMEPPP